MTVSKTVTVWLTPPLFAVIVIAYEPGVVLRSVRMLKADVPDPPEVSEMVLELRLSLGPEGEQTAESETVPVKPFMLARLIVTVPDEPCARVRELTLVLTLKSRT